MSEGWEFPWMLPKIHQLIWAISHAYSGCHNNCARKAKIEGLEDNGQGHAASISAIVLAELVLEEARERDGTAPVGKVVELSELYKSRMEQLGAEVDNKVHSTRLKEKFLAEFPDMQPYTKGRDVLLAFEDTIGIALAKACEEACCAHCKCCTVCLPSHIW